ncbi:MAG TPA: hypothetical protein VKU80_07620, partial [Planctomycetota bacterium]|nr:hypothetical protein [Planctomycetota bacterium]
MPRRGNRGGPLQLLLTVALPLMLGCPRGNSAPPPPSSAPPIQTLSPPSRLRVTVVDAEERPVPEGRLAILSRDAFDSQGRLRAEAVAACPERLKVVVEDAAPGAPGIVALAGRSSGDPLVLPLNGPANRRSTPPFLLMGDREDAAASVNSLLAAPGHRIDVRYRDASVLELFVGPSVIHEIPVRVIAAGPGLPPPTEFEKAMDLRFKQANAVWEPFGRRFVRRSISRIDGFRGLVLIRGRAAGVDAKGHPSSSGLRLDGRDLMIPCAWRDDGAPLTPKAAARALIEKAGKSFHAGLFDGLAGDPEAVLLLWKHGDGTAAAVEGLAVSNDVAQAVAPLSVELADGIEIAPSGSTLSLEETALLATGKRASSEGFDLFVVRGIHSIQTRPAFKVYPEGQFSPLVASSAVVSWQVMDESGRYPYALARA